MAQPEILLRDAAVPLRHYRLAQVKRDLAYEILVDVNSPEAVLSLPFWTSIINWMRIKVGAGAYQNVGATLATAADLGTFSAGETKQCIIEVKVPVAEDVRQDVLAMYLGYGEDWAPVLMIGEASHAHAADNVVLIALTYLVRDEFITPDAAPLDNPRTCEPGPGQLKPGPNNVALRESVAGGKLVYAVATDNSYATSVWYSDTVGVDPRSSDGVGKAAFIEWADLSQTNSKYFGWSQYQAGAAGARFGGFSQVNTSLSVMPEAVSLGSIWTGTNKCLFVVRGECYFFYVVDGLLRWVGVQQLETTATAYIQASPRLNITAGNQQKCESWAVLDLPAEGYTEWGDDFSVVTDSLSAPATDTVFDHGADFHYRLVFTHEDTNYVTSKLRFTDNSNQMQVEAGTTGNLQLKYCVLGSWSYPYSAGVGTLSNGVEYQIDVIVEGTSVKLYLDNVLMTAQTISGLTSETGKISHTLDTNDIELSTHPYPALGIATDRLIAPQENDTFANEADGLFILRTVILPSANYFRIRFRIIDSINWMRIHVTDDGALRIARSVAGSPSEPIVTGAGTVADNDDIVVIFEGDDLEVFVDGTSVGSTPGATIHGTTGDCVLMSWGESIDSIELFPRDVSALLPGDVV